MCEYYQCVCVCVCSSVIIDVLLRKRLFRHTGGSHSQLSSHRWWWVRDDGLSHSIWSPIRCCLPASWDTCWSQQCDNLPNRKSGQHPLCMTYIRILDERQSLVRRRWKSGILIGFNMVKLSIEAGKRAFINSNPLDDCPEASFCMLLWPPDTGTTNIKK